MNRDLSNAELLEKLRAAEARIEELTQTEKNYKTLASSMEFVLCRWLPDTTLVFVNERCRQIFGIQGEAGRIKWMDFLPESARETAIAYYREIIANPRSISYEHSVTVPGGQEREYLWVDSPILDDEGNLVEFQSVGIDITERIRAEKKLLDVENLQRALLNAFGSVMIIALFDPDGIILAINEFGAQSVGRQVDEIKNRSVYDVFPERIAAVIKARIDEVCRSAVLCQFEDFGEGAWYENSLYPVLDADGKVSRVAAAVRNITERKKNEQLLYESEQRYRALAEASRDMIYVITRDDHIAYVNSYAARQLGALPEALIGQMRSRWFNKFDADRMRRGLERVFETGEPNYSETDVVFPNGMIHLSTWLVPLMGRDGVVDRALGVSRDISEQKKMQDALTETNQHLSSIVEERTAELRDSRDQLRKLSQQVIFAQEEERLRLARDLHDDAGQALIGLRMSLEAVYNDLPSDSKKLRRRMEDALSMTDKTVNRIRMLAYNLRPPLLDILGVNMGIKELCHEFSTQTGINVEYVGVELKNINAEAGISLYRFVQEALTNAAKHARAGRVMVALACADETIKLSVENDGRGASAIKNLGLGMVGMQERFNNFGGRLEITSSAFGGLLVQVSLPSKNVFV